jgi:hypothetical protein
MPFETNYSPMFLASLLFFANNAADDVLWRPTAASVPAVAGIPHVSGVPSVFGLCIAGSNAAKKCKQFYYYWTGIPAF